MKALFVCFALFITTSTFAGTSPDTTIVNKRISNTLKKLNSISYMKYGYYIESNYLSENYHREASKKVYIKFDRDEPILGLVYIDTEKDYASVFNGKQYFYINKKANTIELTEKPSNNTFRSQTFFVNSYYTLKHFCPLFWLLIL